MSDAPFGMDPKVLEAMVRKIPANPFTGQVGLNEIMNYFQYNSDMPVIMEILDQSMKEEENRKKVDVSSFDFASLVSTIKRNTDWRITMELLHQVDANGKYHNANYASRIEGLQPVFALTCIVWDMSGGLKLTDEFIGLPTSAVVLEFVQRCIAQPLPGLKPELPATLMFTSNLKAQAEGARLFLDSLPKPFEWTVESSALDTSLKEAFYLGSQILCDKYMELAEELKTKGNEAFVKGDRPAAIEAYEQAIIRGIEAYSERLPEDKATEGLKMLAMCHSNLAAACLIPGDGMDAKRALIEAKKAEGVDPTYGKAYLRTARAYQELGQLGEAQEAIVRALRRPDLRDDMGLINRLIELQTGGDGLPATVHAFDKWMQDILVNDKESARRLEGIGGAWKKRCAEHRRALGEKAGKR